MKRLLIMIVFMLTSVAFTPTVKLEAPYNPIEINMNINIKHEILVKVERQVEELLEDDNF